MPCLDHAGLPDRRLFRDCPGGMAAHLGLGGRELPCLVTGISLSGATLVSLLPWDQLRDADGDASLRAEAIGGGEPIAADLLRTGPDTARLAFRLDPDSELYLRAFLSERPVPLGTW